MNKSESIAEIAKALCKFQSEVENPKNTAVNPMFKSKYAPLDAVINTVKPILAKHGLSFLQSTSSEGESIIIQTIIMHESGEWIESDPLKLPAYQLKKGGEKDFNAQGAGAAITYGRRYSLSAALGISSEDDNDANPAYPDNDPPASLKAKYQVGKGSLDGFEDWVSSQKAKGRTYQQMEHILQGALKTEGA